MAPSLLLERQTMKAELGAAERMLQLHELQNRLARARSQICLLEKAITRLTVHDTGVMDAISNDIYQKDIKEKRRRKHKFEWLRVIKFPEFPDDLMRYILSYLNDNDRFKLRGLSSLFYELYYYQRVHERTKPFKDERAIRLAKRGRRFMMVEHLQTHFDGISRSDLQFISPYNFPRLKSFYSYKRLNGSEFHRLRHPGLVRLSVILENPRLTQSITEQRFPKLEELDLDYRRRVPPLRAINPHSSLKKLTIFKSQLEANFLKSISREHFPELLSITIDSRMNVPIEEFLDLQRQFMSTGIKLKSVSRRNFV